MRYLCSLFLSLTLMLLSKQEENKCRITKKNVCLFIAIAYNIDTHSMNMYYSEGVKAIHVKNGEKNK